MLTTATLVLLLSTAEITAQVPITNDPPQFGPYNGVFFPDGDGLRFPIANTHDTLVLLADSPWTIYCWVKTDGVANSSELVSGIGNTSAEYPRYIGVDAGKVLLWMGEDNQLSAPANLEPGQVASACCDLRWKSISSFSDGQAVGKGNLLLGSTNPLLQMAPTHFQSYKHFGGQIAGFTVLRRALSDADVSQLHRAPPDFSLLSTKGQSPGHYKREARRDTAPSRTRLRCPKAVRHFHLRL